MSQRFEEMLNNSQISDGVTETSGLELQLYVGQGNHHRIRLDQSVHQRLSLSLKHIIFMPVLQMKNQEENVRFSGGEAMTVAPVSYVKEEDDGFHLRPNNMQSSEPRSMRRHRTCIAIGEVRTSFVVPENSEINFFDMDKIKHRDDLEAIGTDSDQPYQFSFAKRLDDWIIERSQRQCGMRDTNFYHTKSKKRFRSTKEVANFILYEVYPRSSYAQRKRKMAQENGLNDARTLYSQRKSEAIAIETSVVGFLERSLINMLRMNNYH